MSLDQQTFEVVADTIAEECAVPRDKILPDSNIAFDLGLDSIAFLDVCYALDLKLGIKIPFEQWVNDINSGKTSSKDAFKVSSLVHEISQLVAASKAAPAALAASGDAAP